MGHQETFPKDSAVSKEKEPSWLRGSKQNLLDKVELGENGASLIAQLVKNPLQCRRPQFDSWVGRIHWRRERLPTPVFWPGELVQGVAKSQT